MSTQGIFLSWIVVKDIQAAIDFYTEVVGLKLCEYHQEFGWAELSGPSGSTLGIAQENPAEAIKAGSNAIITITVDDIEQARAEFMKKNVKMVGEMIEIPHHVKMQTCMDHDGNAFQLVQMLSVRQERADLCCKGQ